MASVLDNSGNSRYVPTVTLIKAVKEKKCLWDRTSACYKDRSKRDKTWREIYKQFEPNFDDLSGSEKLELGLQITKKWYNVRDAYAKSRKNIKLKRPYVYAENLSFLDPIYFDQIHTESEQNSDESKNDENSNIGEDNDGISSRHFQEEVYLEVEDDIFEPPTKKSRTVNTSATEVNDNLLEQRHACTGEEESLASILGNIIEREEDEDKSFFKSILSSVKLLSDDSKFEFRISVLKLLRALKNKDKDRIDVKCEVSRVDFNNLS